MRNPYGRCCALAVVGVLAATTVGCGGGSGGDDDPGTMTVARASPGLPLIALEVAEAEGMFEEHGLEVEFVDVEGSAEATAAVQSGQADFTIQLPEGVITARAAGAPVKMVGGTVDENLYGLYVGEGIDELGDLAGEKVGMLEEGNGTDIQLRYVLDERGAGSSESTFVAVGAVTNRLAALRQGQIAGALLFPPYDVEAEKAGLKLLYEVGEVVDGYPNEVIAANENSLEENPEGARAFMAAMTDAAQFIVDNPERTVEIAAEATGGDPKVLRESYDRIRDSYDTDGAIDPEGLEWTLEVMEEYGDVDDLPSADEVYDPSYLPGEEEGEG